MVANVRETLKKFFDGMGEFAQDKGESVAAFRGLLGANGKPGALDTKTKELLEVGIAIVIRCEVCIVYHVWASYQAGATKAELLDVAQSALSMGGGPAMAYISTTFLAAVNEFEHDFDK